MFSSIVNSIPVVGHGKSFLHYVAGDTEGAKRAFKEATRSSAVLAGGVAGVVGGPAGMIAGATAAGMLTDTVYSVAGGEPEGFIAGVADIGEDISNGEIPVGSVMRTTLIVGSDAIGGLGGGSLSTCAGNVLSKTATKSVAKEVLKQVVTAEGKVLAKTAVAYGATRTFIKHDENHHKWSSKPSRSSGSKGSSSGSGSSSSGRSSSNNDKKSDTTTGGGTGGGTGGQPPRDNNENKTEHEKDKKLSHWEAFFEIFGVTNLDDIDVGGVKIFKDLEDGQKGTLKRLIATIRNTGYLDLAMLIKIIIKVLIKLANGNLSDITFQNFLSVAQFVQTYVGERIAEKNDGFDDDSSDEEYKSRRKQFAKDILEELMNSILKLVSLFQSLASKITNLMSTISPTFRSIFAAVAHFFKHKIVPGKGILLTVEQYFGFIKDLLKKLKPMDAYKDLVSGRRTSDVVFEMYYEMYGRRFKIVVKVQGGSLELSSGYFVFIFYEDDTDGCIFLDCRKL